MNTTRHGFILGATVGALGATMPRAAQAQPATQIRIVGVPIDVSAPPYYALEEGFFKKVGLDAQISSLGNGAQIIAALVGGQMDFGAGGTSSVALAHEQGIPLAVVAPSGAYSVSIHSHGLVVAPGSTIRAPRDITGKTIATAGLKTIADVALHAWFSKNGVDAASVKLVEIPYGAMMPALLAGRVDAVDLEEPYLAAALAQGGRFFANVFDAIAPEWVEGAFFCTEDYAKAHPDVVRKFADAIAMAANWGNHHPVEAWNVLNKYAKSATPTSMPHCLYPERLRASDFQPVIDASAKYGLLKASFPAKDLFAPGLGA